MTNEHSHDDDIIIGPGFTVLPFKENEKADTGNDSSDNNQNASTNNKR